MNEIEKMYQMAGITKKYCFKEEGEICGVYETREQAEEVLNCDSEWENNPYKIERKIYEEYLADFTPEKAWRVLEMVLQGEGNISRKAVFERKHTRKYNAYRVHDTFYNTQGEFHGDIFSSLASLVNETYWSEKEKAQLKEILEA